MRVLLIEDTVDLGQAVREQIADDELRTPLAATLAQVQPLRHDAPDGPLQARVPTAPDDAASARP